MPVVEILLIPNPHSPTFYGFHSLPIDQLVRTVMTLFQDQPELLLGFKEFLPEAQGLLNQLVPVSLAGIIQLSTI